MFAMHRAYIVHVFGFCCESFFFLVDKFFFFLYIFKSSLKWMIAKKKRKKHYFNLFSTVEDAFKAIKWKTEKKIKKTLKYFSWNIKKQFHESDVHRIDLFCVVFTSFIRCSNNIQYKDTLVVRWLVLAIFHVIIIFPCRDWFYY